MCLKCQFKTTYTWRFPLETTHYPRFSHSLKTAVILMINKTPNNSNGGSAQYFNKCATLGKK